MFSKYLLLLAVLGLHAPSLQADTLKMAVGEWPPYLSEELDHGGNVAQLIGDIFRAEGYEVELKFLPWGRAYEEASAARMDMTAVWMHKPEREVDFHYSEPVLEEQFVLFHLKTFDFNWNNINDLKGLSIGGGIKYSYGKEFDVALESGMLSMQRVPTDEHNFKKLLAGRIQIYPQEKNVAYAALRGRFPSSEVEQVTHHPKILLNNLSYVLFPKKSPRSEALLERFNARLKVFKSNGQYAKYFE